MTIANMPKIIQTKTGGIFRWDQEDWLAGLSPNFIDSTWGVVSLTNGLSFSNALNPNRRAGFLEPGSSITTPTNASTLNAVQKNIVTYNSYAYSVGGERLNRIDLSSNTVSNSGDWPHTINHAHNSEAGEDVIVYYIGATPYLFYSFNDETDGDVGRYDFASTFDDDYMSAAATSGAVLNRLYPHPMVVGDDGILYIANGNNLASFNQSGTTFNSSALDLPTGYIIRSFAKTDNFLVIYANRPSISGSTYYRTECTAFFWDYVSSSFIYAFDLSGNYVNGGFSINNQPGCFVQGRYSSTANARQSKMMLFDGSGFKPVFTFNENVPEHGGVDVLDNIITWNSDGVVYQWGTPYIGFDKPFNRIALGSSTSNGCLKNLAGDVLYVSTGTSTSGGMDILSYAGFSSSARARVAQIGVPSNEFSRGRITKVRVTLGRVGDTGNKLALSILYDVNQSKTILNGTTHKMTKQIQEFSYDTSDASLPIFYQLGWQATYVAGTASETPDIIKSIEIFFEYINN